MIKLVWVLDRKKLGWAWENWIASIQQYFVPEIYTQYVTSVEELSHFNKEATMALDAADIVYTFYPSMVNHLKEHFGIKANKIIFRLSGLRGFT